MVRWADPEAMARAVDGYAETVRARHPEVTRVIWYGSWIEGIPTPTSDVDHCVVVTTDSRRPRNRIPDFLPDRFPTGIDLVVLTEREWEGLEERSPGWYRAIAAGREV